MAQSASGTRCSRPAIMSSPGSSGSRPLNRPRLTARREPRRNGGGQHQEPECESGSDVQIGATDALQSRARLGVRQRPLVHWRSLSASQ